MLIVIITKFPFARETEREVKSAAAAAAFDNSDEGGNTGTGRMRVTQWIIMQRIIIAHTPNAQFTFHFIERRHSDDMFRMSIFQ